VSRLHGDALVRDGVLDFAVNVWPARQPARLRRAMRDALDQRTYPDDRPAREAIARRHGRSPSEVLPANGACEAIWLLAHALRPKRAACVEPCFTEPRAAFEAVGADVATLARDPGDWSFDPASLGDGPELVYVGNPNNPTGGLDDREALLALLRPGRLVVVDESFMDFVPGGAASLAEVPVPGLAVLRSLTKLWCLPGIRAGYLLAEPDLVRRLERHRQPWPVNAVALAAMTVCAGDTHSPGYAAREVAGLRAALAAELRAIAGVQVWDAAANFLLLRVGDGRRVADHLRGERIAVRPARDFATLTPDFIRVAVRGHDDNARLAAAMREAIEAC
jgi:histidinol-phosphate/aromatic aminotransferase/cobyric acid decarboxylase-like protein